MSRLNEFVKFVTSREIPVRYWEIECGVESFNYTVGQDSFELFVAGTSHTAELALIHEMSSALPIDIARSMEQDFNAYLMRQGVRVLGDEINAVHVIVLVPVAPIAATHVSLLMVAEEEARRLRKKFLDAGAWEATAS